MPSEMGDGGTGGSGLLPVGASVGSRTTRRDSRRLGREVSVVQEHRGEILSMAYGLAATGAIGAWIADPGAITNAIGMGLPVVLAVAVSIAAFVFRRHLPRHTEDAAVVASLGLLSAGIAYTRLGQDPALFTAYYVWVGFASPMWFPTRRAVAYLGLTGVACGADMLLAGTGAALASWSVTMAILVVAFLAVHFLARTLVQHERLAAVGEMAAAVGHELRNPLSAVTNALFLARHELGGGLTPAVDRHLQLAEREMDRAVSIAENLVAFVRPRRAVMGPVDLRAVVAEVLESTTTPPAIDVHVDVGLVSVVADRVHLAEVLGNLVANAYQAMGSGGSLLISAAEQRSRCVITVQDTGAGIDDSVVGRV
ncbi:MAG: sensor histidine kinase, partial [Acidimicrobiales bacterium]